jgi:peptidyl-prolyl cis-trans isomerase SurA
MARRLTIRGVWWLAMLLAVPVCGAQQTPPAPAADAGQGQTVDRVVAIVNGDLILESDVDEERRLAAFQPFSQPAGGFSRERAIERLINRSLILQQAKLQGTAPVSKATVDAQIQTLRKDIPACKRYQCETDAGWNRFLADQGFTTQELEQRWKERMEVLAFIENRFRTGIEIEPAEIKDYYEKTLLPEYAKQKATAPALADISTRIQEILLQQRVSKLLEDWLQSLRAQGTVQIMKPGEVAP